MNLYSLSNTYTSPFNDHLQVNLSLPVAPFKWEVLMQIFTGWTSSVVNARFSISSFTQGQNVPGMSSATRAAGDQSGWRALRSSVTDSVETQMSSLTSTSRMDFTFRASTTTVEGKSSVKKADFGSFLWVPGQMSRLPRRSRRLWLCEYNPATPTHCRPTVLGLLQEPGLPRRALCISLTGR